MTPVLCQCYLAHELLMELLPLRKNCILGLVSCAPISSCVSHTRILGQLVFLPRDFSLDVLISAGLTITGIILLDNSTLFATQIKIDSPELLSKCDSFFSCAAYFFHLQL